MNHRYGRLAVVVLAVTACTSSPHAPSAKTSAGSPGAAGTVPHSSQTTLTNRPVPSAGCGHAPSIRPGTTGQLTVTVPPATAQGQRQRVLELHVPPGYNPRIAIPLILVFHGAGGTVAGAEPSSGMSALADQDGFLVAYPQGLREPGTGRFGWAVSGPADPEANGIDDGLFTSLLLNEIQARYCVDPTRIDATGMSNGGGMAGYLACVLANRIAAFAPVEGEFFQIPGGCHPAHPATVLDVHVQTDPAAPFAGMPARGSPEYYADPVPIWLHNWAQRDGCQDQPRSTTVSHYVVQTWSACPAGAAVSGVDFPSGGHSWFGFTGVPAGVRMLAAFFRAHPLRPAPRSWTPGQTTTVPALAGPRLAVRELRLFRLPAPDAMPVDIAAGPGGTIWFTEFRADQIGRISTAGVLTEYRVPTPGAEPYQISAGPGGAMWFTEYNTAKIGRVTSNGQVTEFALPRPTYGGFGLRRAPDGDLFITDPAGSVDRISAAGAITRIPLRGDAGTPFAVAVSPAGQAWFSEFRGYFEYSTTLVPLASQNAPVTLPDPVSDIDSVSAGPANALWFADYGTSQVGELNLATRHVRLFPAGPRYGGLNDIVAGPDGVGWFTEQAGIVGRASARGTVAEFALSEAGSNPDGIAFGPGNAIWVAESGTSTIAELTAS